MKLLELIKINPGFAVCITTAISIGLAVSGVYTVYNIYKPIDNNTIEEEIVETKNDENLPPPNFENLPPLPPPLFETSKSSLKKGLLTSLLRF